MPTFHQISPPSGLCGHGGAVQVAVFNATGSHCLSGGTDRVINLWNPYKAPYAEDDAAAGALIVQQYRGHAHDVTGISVARDGALFASVGGDKCAFVWDTERGEATRRVYGHDSRVACVALGGASGASVLATGGDDMTLRLHDLLSPATRGPVAVLRGFRDKVTGVALEGAAILASSLDGTLRTWDLRAGRATCDSLGSSSGGEAAGAAPAAAAAAAAPLTALAPPTPATALLASTRAGGTLLLVDRPTATVLASLTGHSCKRYRCTPSLLPSGTGVLCGGEGGEVLHWDALAAASGSSPVPLPQAHRGPVAYVDSRTLGTGETVALTAGHDGSVRLWEVREGGGARAVGARQDVALQRSLGRQ
jgi:mitogen-activated protein kinase organizer 1